MSTLTIESPTGSASALRPTPTPTAPARAASELAPPAGSLTERLFASAVLTRLRGLREGVLEVEAGGALHRFGSPTPDGLAARVTVRDPAFWRVIALRGTVGAGEAYADGLYDLSDLTSLIRIFVRNHEALWAMEGGLARLTGPLLKLAHALRPNTRAGAQRNIAAHYDISNAFYERMLDPTMTYSSGIFEHEAATLEAAQVAKLDRVCRLLELCPSDHLLEIGTGWGSLALHAATRYGCRVTTTTISKEQHAYALARVEAAGLSDRVTVLLKDYRDLTGTYDKAVSIEMVEAIGHRQFETFHRVLADRLTPTGLAVVQAITIQDRLYEAARDTVDFIKHHVFPGCCIPSVAALVGAAARASDLTLTHMQDFGPHYARTLRAWHARLDAAAPALPALGLDARFHRLWAFYLSYCEGGFLEGQLGVCHLVYAKPGARRVG